MQKPDECVLDSHEKGSVPSSSFFYKIEHSKQKFIEWESFVFSPLFYIYFIDISCCYSDKPTMDIDIQYTHSVKIQLSTYKIQPAERQMYSGGSVIHPVALARCHLAPCEYGFTEP